MVEFQPHISGFVATCIYQSTSSLFQRSVRWIVSGSISPKRRYIVSPVQRDWDEMSRPVSPSAPPTLVEASRIMEVSLDLRMELHSMEVSIVHIVVVAKKPQNWR